MVHSSLPHLMPAAIRQSAYAAPCAALDALDIAYTVTEHPAVHTIAQMEKLPLSLEEQHGVVKNLFVRDDKKRQYYLLVLLKDKTADLKAIRTSLGCRPLSLASEADLSHYLGLAKGMCRPWQYSMIVYILLLWSWIRIYSHCPR